MGSVNTKLNLILELLATSAMSVTTSSTPAGHVAVCAFPFTSHPLALYSLVCRLAEEAPQLHFSFLCTSRANSKISTKTTILPTNIKISDIEDGLPEGFEPEDLAQEASNFYKQFPENFKRGVDAAVEETGGKRVTSLIVDGLFSFDLGNMAEEMNVPWVAFTVPAPYDLAAWLQKDLIQQLYANAQMDHDHPEDQLIDIVPGLPPSPFKDFPHELLERNPSNQLLAQVLLSMIRKIQEASAVVMNSYEELNPLLLTNYLKSKFLNIFYVSSVTPSKLASGTDATRCLSWLDEQKSASVAYISFGTTAPLNGEEVKALAEALEEGGVPFLWSINDKFKEYLPDGFTERIGTRGKLVPWAPQRQVLEHPSIGVHVTHGGYNAVLESIMGGVPMICRSEWADNHLNAKMVEEVWGIGVRVENRLITKTGMLKCLEMIFHQEEGKVRQASTALKQVFEKAAGPDGVAANHVKTLLHIISEER